MTWSLWAVCTSASHQINSRMCLSTIVYIQRAITFVPLPRHTATGAITGQQMVIRLSLYRTFIQSVLQLPHIQPFIDWRRCQPCKGTTNTSGAVLIEPATCLLADMLLPPELLPPQQQQTNTILHHHHPHQHNFVSFLHLLQQFAISSLNLGILRTRSRSISSHLNWSRVQK